MKKSKIVWGIALITIAVLLLLNAFGVTLGLPEGIPLWRILLGALCLFWVINELIKLRIPGIFFPLTFIVMLFEGEIAKALNIHPDTGNIASAWLFLLTALLLTIGSSLLLPAKLRGRAAVSFQFNGNSAGKGHKIGAKSVRYIDCSEPFHELVENNMSSCEVFFTNASNYSGDGTVCVENNMGSIVLHVPIDWYVSSSIENNMGSIQISGNHDQEGGKRLNLTGENNMGSVRVVFVESSGEST